LLTGGWLRQLLLAEPDVTQELLRQFPAAPLDYLPDPCPAGYGGDPLVARQALGVPSDRRVFLFYGTASRRKGLHLVVQAVRELPEADRAFLLCVGQQNPEDAVTRALDQLVQQGRAQLINRFVSVAEEKLSFAAADVVLLPYLQHFGGSGVLSRAMASGKMVIVSDEQLLGHLTRGHGLGLLFRPGDAAGLRDRMHEAANFSDEQFAAFAAAARRYAEKYSRAAFRQVLLKSLGVAPQEQPHA
jgi:glycosyltransferase involved in cell wall biosynthesis